MNKEELKRLSGVENIHGVLFPYRVSAAPTNKALYSSVLNVYISDPESGHRMQNIQKRNRARAVLQLEIDNKASLGPLVEELAADTKKKIDSIDSGKTRFDIFASRYLKPEESNAATVKKYAHECASALYAKYELELLRKLKEKPEIGRHNSNQLYIRYHRDFFLSRKGVTSATQKNYESTLNAACTFLMEKPFVEVDDKDVARLFKDNRFVQMKNMICEFFDYCQDRGAYSGSNPIKNYLDKNVLGKPKNNKSLYAQEISHLPFDIEKRLHELIAEHINDREIMAVILAKGFGMSLSEIMDLRWDRIFVIDNHVVIYSRKDRNSGSLHDFTRPVLKESSDFIIQIRNREIEKYGTEDDIKGRKVVPIRIRRSSGLDTEADIKARLSKYVRNILIEAGLTPEWINTSIGTTRAPGGSGLALLHKHYNYVLTERCGIDLDSPEGKYLRGLIPEGTTHGYYRSMNDSVSGIPFFLIVMRRDDCFSEKHEVIPQVEIVTKEDTSEIKIPAYGPGQRTNVSIKKIFIPAGTRITIRAAYGIEGEVRFSETERDDNLPIEELY